MWTLLGCRDQASWVINLPSAFSSAQFLTSGFIWDDGFRWVLTGDTFQSGKVQSKDLVWTVGHLEAIKWQKIPSIAEHSVHIVILVCIACLGSLDNCCGPYPSVTGELNCIHLSCGCWHPFRFRFHNPACFQTKEFMSLHATATYLPNLWTPF
jgi:hypothetical protein